jgi:Nucleoside 2-deoxyribosyltransferase
MALYYVAHRLFAAHDRALGAYVAHLLAGRVGADAVFLPFCDTDEEELVAASKGRRLFELDSERLSRIDGMLALLHGPSLDDGVCLEIGYAAALGVPVVVLTTDFQTYGPSPAGPAFAFPDPLLEIFVTETVRVHRLGPPEASGTGDRFEAFLNRNLQPVRRAADLAITALLSAMPRDPSPGDAAGHARRLAYIEPSPYVDGDLWRAASRQLRVQGWDVHVAARLQERNDPRAAARDDWAAACRAQVTFIDPRGPETPPGAALLIGACAATGRLVLAVDPDSWWTFAEGREANWRNLMVQYAVGGRFTSIEEIAALGAPEC